MSPVYPIPSGPRPWFDTTWFAKTCFAKAGPGGTRVGSAGAWRSAVLFGLLFLAACGSQQRTAAPSFGAAAPTRPTSYDPPGPPGDPWGPYIEEASRRFDVPQRWIREVMRQESAGRVTATSSAGAIGLMQVMPGTYAELRTRYGLGSDPYHPWDSIMAGTAYLRQMYDLYGSPAFLAAYNAGPRRLEDYLWNGRGLPNETRNYVARIGPRVVDASPRRRAAPEIYAAAEIPTSIPPGPRRMDRNTMLALREQRDRLDANVQLASLPAGPVARMEPIADGSTYGGAAGGAISGDAAPSTAAAPSVSSSQLAAAGTMSMMPIINPGDRPADSEPMLASASVLSEPLVPPAGSGGGAASSIRLAEATPAPATHAEAPRRFGLVPSASAGTLPGGLQAVLARHAPPARSPAAAPAGGDWAVQVGAFSSERQARDAAARARSVVPGSAARLSVMPVAQGRSTLWRARVTGLTRDAAQAACGRLRSRGDCMILTPDAQG